MDETSWSSDFYSDALESFSYINKYSKTEILAFCYWHNLLVIGRRVVKFRGATRTPTWNYSHDFSLNCAPLSPITIIIVIINFFGGEGGHTYRTFSLTWPAYMQIYENKRNC